MGLLHLLGAVIDPATFWVQGCPCRSWTPAEALLQASKYLRQKMFFIASGLLPFMTCPLRGRRAPEMAAGKLLEFLEALFDECAWAEIMRLVQL